MPFRMSVRSYSHREVGRQKLRDGPHRNGENDGLSAAWRDVIAMTG